MLPSPDSGSSLTVTRCSFVHCHASGSVGGGGVFAQRVGSASVCDSYFYDCSCGTSDYMEGGGVLLNYIAVKPSIARSMFVLCQSSDDAAGCGIWCSNASLPYAVDSCQYFKCEGLSESGSEGGGIMLWSNTDFVTCTNSLFYACKAKSRGGAICISYVSRPIFKPITFCFFKENKSDKGRDVYFQDFPSTPLAITHSFSFEAASGRVFGRSDDWLPQAIMNPKIRGAKIRFMYHGRRVSLAVSMCQNFH